MSAMISLMEQVMPWPVSLGIAGGSIAILVSFLYWMLRKLAKGDWVPRIQVEAMIALEKARANEVIAATLKASTEQIKLHLSRGDEWKETAEIERAGREQQAEIAKNAVDGLRTVDYFLSTIVPKRGIEAHNELGEAGIPHE